LYDWCEKQLSYCCYIALVATLRLLILFKWVFACTMYSYSISYVRRSENEELQLSLENRTKERPRSQYPCIKIL